MALSKREDTLELNPGFRSRWRALKSCSIISTPIFWDWIERAIQRIRIIIDWSEGLHPSASLTEFEKTIPSLLDELESLGGDQANDAFFEKILWPWMQAHAAEIEKQPGFEKQARSRHGEAKKMTLALVKPDFKRAWRIYADRPEGRLYPITRSR